MLRSLASRHWHDLIDAATCVLSSMITSKGLGLGGFHIGIVATSGHFIVPIFRCVIHEHGNDFPRKHDADICMKQPAQSPCRRFSLAMVDATPRGLLTGSAYAFWNDSTSWSDCTAAAPSPTAVATRLMELLRTSPTANIPGRLVSRK